MEWQVALALILVAPVVSLPVTFIMYLNIGGMLAAIQRLAPKVDVPHG